MKTDRHRVYKNDRVYQVTITYYDPVHNKGPVNYVAVREIVYKPYSMMYINHTSEIDSAVERCIEKIDKERKLLEGAND